MKRHRKVTLWLLALLWFGGMLPAVSGEFPDTVGVRQLMTHSGDYVGVLEIEGVVSRVYPEDGLIALIDLAEFRECRVVTCANLTLPVRWQGPYPVVQNHVRARGAVRKEGIRMVFAASALDDLGPVPGER